MLGKCVLMYFKGVPLKLESPKLLFLQRNGPGTSFCSFCNYLTPFDHLIMRRHYKKLKGYYRIKFEFNDFSVIVQFLPSLELLRFLNSILPANEGKLNDRLKFPSAILNLVALANPHSSPQDILMEQLIKFKTY